MSVPVDNAKNPPVGRPAKLGRLALAAVAAATAWASIAGWLGARWFWPCELACHFRVQYFWLLAFFGVIYAVRRRYWPAAALAAVAAANLAVVLPIYLPVGHNGPAGAPLRLVSCNVLMTNHKYAPLVTLLREVQPDLFALVEVDRRWISALGPLRATYPYSHQLLQGGRFGIALYSRRPWQSIDELWMGSHRAPVLRARFEIEGRKVVVYCTHTMSPATRWQANQRNLELLDLARMIEAEHDPVILAGDLNSTGWSPLFADLLSSCRLQDSRQGFGVQASWPTECMLLGIPIDHCLVSPEIQVVGRRLGPRVGSDHLPIVVDLTLPAGAAAHTASRERRRPDGAKTPVADEENSGR
jgi:endonuclease/exonuclease/phosphatase (EEP) superfamily protein YafD